MTYPYNSLKPLLNNLFYFGATSVGVYITLVVVISILKKLSNLKYANKPRITYFVGIFTNYISQKLLLLISMFIGAISSPIPNPLRSILSAFVFIILGFILVKTTLQFVDRFLNDLVFKQKRLNRALLPIMQIGAKVIIWSTFVLFVLQNLGYNVTSLIAGLGIGGVAIAFALQNILSDIFSSFSILLDNIIEVGDFVETPEFSGTVKKVGIKTTRLESLDGQEIIVPNKHLTESILKNYSRMNKRRVQLQIGIVYETPNEKVVEALKIIRNVLENTSRVDRIQHVIFRAFGDWALILEAVFFIKPADYDTYTKTLHQINMQLKEKLEQAGINIAYPTQVVKVHQDHSRPISKEI